MKKALVVTVLGINKPKLLVIEQTHRYRLNDRRIYDLETKIYDRLGITPVKCAYQYTWQPVIERMLIRDGCARHWYAMANHFTNRYRGHFAITMRYRDGEFSLERVAEESSRLFCLVNCTDHWVDTLREKINYDITRSIFNQENY